LKHLILSEHIDLDELKQNSLGGKALHLLKMQKAGFPVPYFIVLNSKFIETLLLPINKDIYLQMNEIKAANDEKILSVSENIQKKIRGLEFPLILQEEINQICLKAFGENYCVAVRSSACMEDGTKASFAGQYETFLFVDEKHLIPKILDCVASCFGAGVLRYQLFHGIVKTEVQFAVIVQEMINADKSGIGFSMNINENLADMILVAGYGLGQGIVNDSIESDTFIINRQYKTIEKRINRKKSGLRFSSETGLKEAPVDENLQDKEILDREEINQITDYLLKTEKLLGMPSDIEFSFDQDGKLYILQMRPITTLNIRDIKILDNTNIVESYPGITLPLSFSFALMAYNMVFRGSSKAFWISARTIRKQSDIFENLLEHVHGRIYYRLDNWYQMISLVHSSHKSVQAWEKAVGLSNSESNTVISSFRGKIRTLISSTWLLLNYRRGNKYFFRQFNIHYNSLCDYKNQLISEGELWRHFTVSTSKLFKPWHLTLINDFLAFKTFGWLEILIKKYKIDNNDGLANDLVSQARGVESVEAMIKVLELKEHIVSDPLLSELFSRETKEIIQLLQDPEYSMLNLQINNYLKKYGDRTLAELKLETKSLRQHPEIFIGMLKNQLTSPLSLEKFNKNRAHINEIAAKKVSTKLKWWDPKAYFFSIIQNLATYGLKNRENMRFCRSRAFGVVKEIFLEIGKMMVRDKILLEPEDVFYLDMKYLEDFCLQNNRRNLVELVSERKIKFSEYNTSILPDRMMYIGNNVPLFAAPRTKEEKNMAHQGIAVSRGKVSAKAVIITEPKFDVDVKGKILVTRMTDPGWVFLMAQAAGLVSEKGSLLSHTAIVGRELGIPVVVGVYGATTYFKNGDLLILDGDLGNVSLQDLK
jgi:pyruvate,water dikinase